MHALSLWQPWALLWLSPAKPDETRHWPTRITGTIAVHAAKTTEGMRDCDDLHPILTKYFGPNWRDQIAYGALIGTVNLKACYRAGHAPHAITPENEMCGNHAPGRYLFHRGDYTRFAQPIPWRGLQGFFQVPDSILTEAPKREDLFNGR